MVIKGVSNFPRSANKIRHGVSRAGHLAHAARPCSALLGFAALEQVTPVLSRHLDIELLCRGQDALPGSGPLLVADTFDLVEACDSVADVSRIAQGLLALGREREIGVSEAILLGRADAFPHSGDLLAVSTGALHLPRPLDVLSCRLFLLRGGHDHLLLFTPPSTDNQGSPSSSDLPARYSDTRPQGRT